MFSHVAVPLLAMVLNFSEPGYKLEIAEAKRVEAVLTIEIHAPRFKAEEWIMIAARLPQLPGQIEVSSKLEPGGTARQELTPLHRPILEARLNAREFHFEKGPKVTVTYEVTLRSRKLVPLEPGENSRPIPPLKPDIKKLFLEPSETLDFNSKEFQKWLGTHHLHRKEGEADLDFARRAFLTIRKSFTYEWPVPHDGKASSTCRAGKGDCGCMSAVFVSTLRAGGVPARALVGHWAASQIPGKKPGDEPNYQTHVKAECFAEGIGWVPVDQTQALDDKSPSGLRFFGHDPGDFIVQNIDFDMLVDTVHFGRQRVTILQGVPYWATGKGTLDGSKSRENWQVRVTGK